MLAGASERPRSFREHDQTRMSLHLRGRSRREAEASRRAQRGRPGSEERRRARRDVNSCLFRHSPRTARFFTCVPIKSPIPRVISREFGRQHQHMMHESCCAYREQHHGVLDAVMAGCFVYFLVKYHDFVGDGMTIPVTCVISREFGREHQHMMHELCCAYREQHHDVLEAFMSGCFGTFFQ